MHGNFNLKTWRRAYFGDLSVDGGIILKYVVNKRDVRLWIPVAQGRVWWWVLVNPVVRRRFLDPLSNCQILFPAE